MKLEEEIKQKTFNNPYHRMTVNVLFTASWLQTNHMRMLKPFGLTPQQFNVMRILRGQHPGAASVSLIQERMLDRSSNASRLVDKLLAKKLVDRKTCPDDRRQVDIKITQAGLDLLAKMDAEMKKTEEQMQQALTEQEAVQLGELLDKLRG
jgi:DNA-binding MarR family transcriptional regulator